jgi:hypothetical protein
VQARINNLCLSSCEAHDDLFSAQGYLRPAQGNTPAEYRHSHTISLVRVQSRPFHPHL